MRHNLFLSFFFVLAGALFVASCSPDNRSSASVPAPVVGDEQARLQQLFAEYHRDFPAATLKDMYKYGFQDVFGPAHIIGDSLSCARYVESEVAYLDSIGWRYREPYEPLQLCGQYVRVNVLTVKEGRLSTQQLVGALIRSGAVPDSADLVLWQKQWPQVEKAIAPLAADLPGYAEDKAFIDSLLAAGQYVSHHSSAFNAANHYGYRLVRKDIFDKELLPFLLAEH